MKGFSSTGHRRFSSPIDTHAMRAAPGAASPSETALPSTAHPAQRRGRWSPCRPAAFTGGGTNGNAQLTAVTGLILIVLLAVIGVTILRIGQLIWLHLFIGFLLIGPVALKMGSTGYRFARYYTRDHAYRRKGPPETLMRLIAPVLVLSTIVVFVSGVILLFQGPHDRGQMLLIHKASFFVWVAFTALHLLGHLPDILPLLGWGSRAGEVRRARLEPPGLEAGRAGRRIALAGALVGGLVLAIVLIPDFAAWTQHGVLAHHHRGNG